MDVSLLPQHPAVAAPALGRGGLRLSPGVSPSLHGSITLGEIWGKLQWHTYALIAFFFPSVSFLGKKGYQEEKEAGEGDKAVD